MEIIAMVSTLKGMGFTVGQIVNSAIICLVVHTTVVHSMTAKFTAKEEKDENRFKALEAHTGFPARGNK